MWREKDFFMRFEIFRNCIYEVGKNLFSKNFSEQVYLFKKKKERAMNSTVFILKCFELSRILLVL